MFDFFVVDETHNGNAALSVLAEQLAKRRLTVIILFLSTQGMQPRSTFAACYQISRAEYA